MAAPSSKYRSPGNNNLLTKGLFFETTLADKSSVVYTLKDWDHTANGVTYPSLYRLYMDLADPTEYRFATTYLDCWDQWESLCACTWFKDIVARWRHHLDLKIRSHSLARIMAAAKTPSRDSFMANRYLLEKAWEPKDSKRGRPSKEEIKREATEIVRIEGRLADDFKRLGIN